MTSCTREATDVGVMRNRKVQRTIGLVAATGLMALASTGCGGSASNGVRGPGTSALRSTTTAASLFACLKREGFKVAGEHVDGAPTGAAPAEINKALQRCGVTMRGSAVRGEVNRAVVRRELLRNVQCIREHGFAVTAGKNIEVEPYDTHGVNTADPAFRVAVGICRKKYTEAISRLSPGSVPLESDTGSASVEEPRAAVSNGPTGRCIRRLGGAPVKAGHTLGFKVAARDGLHTVSRILARCDVG